LDIYKDYISCRSHGFHLKIWREYYEQDFLEICCRGLSRKIISYKPNQEILGNLPFFRHSIDKRPKVKDFIIGYLKESWDIVSGQGNKIKKPGKIKSGNIIDNPIISKDDFEPSSLNDAPEK